jgi:hypothetical protein
MSAKELVGLPNFRSPLTTGDLLLYEPWGTGSYWLLPSQITVAQDGTGKPKFTLALVKCQDDPSAAGQYAVLDLSLGGDFPLDEALAAARAVTPDATVAPIAINRGFTRLYATTTAVPLPADLTTPVPLGWGGPDLGRWTTRLSIDSGELIKGAISNQALLFSARIEFDLIGVCAAIDVTVEFEPAVLLKALLSGSANRQIAYTDLLAFFTHPREALPLKIVGTLSDADVGLFPQVMADRIAAAYSVLVPAPAVTDHPFGSFIDPSDPVHFSAGTVRWDLSLPVAVPRQSVFLLDTLTGLQATDPASLVKEVFVPPLPLGFYRIDLAANLPSPRIGVPAIGVNIAVPANPPMRPFAVSQTVTFTSPDDRGSASLQLSPAEPLHYALSGFAVVVAGNSVEEITLPPRSLTTPWVQLQCNDFPVQFSHLNAASRLLQMAEVSGILTYGIGGKIVQQSFALTAAAPGLAVAAPPAAINLSITVTVTPNDGSAALILSLQFADYNLDVTSFPEYGPHRISIECQLSPGSSPVFVELIPDYAVNDPAAGIAKQVFTPDQPNAVWGYFTPSPFRPGYRYRFAATASNAAPQPWSAALSPFAVLTLNPESMMPTISQASLSQTN